MMPYRSSDELATRVEARVRSEWPGTHTTGHRGLLEAPEIREGGATDALVLLMARIIREEEQVSE